MGSSPTFGSLLRGEAASPPAHALSLSLSLKKMNK